MTILDVRVAGARGKRVLIDREPFGRDARDEADRVGFRVGEQDPDVVEEFVAVERFPFGAEKSSFDG